MATSSPVLTLDDLREKSRKRLGVTAPQKKADTPPPSALKRILTQAGGAPEDLDTSWASFKRDAPTLLQAQTWLTSLKQAISGLNPFGGISEAEAAAETRIKKQRGQFTPKKLATSGGLALVTGGLSLPYTTPSGVYEWLMSGFPYAGPSAVRSAEQEQSGDIAGSYGSAIQAALMSRAAPEIAERMGTGPLRVGAQFLTGVGQDAVERARRQFGVDVDKEGAQYHAALKKQLNSILEEQNSLFNDHASAVEKYQEALKKQSGTDLEARKSAFNDYVSALEKRRVALEAQRNSILDKLAEERQKATTTSARQSGANVRESVTSSNLRGPVYQRIQGMADTTFQGVQTLDENIRKFQNGEWQKLDTVAGDAQVPWPEDAIQKARATLKTPESIASFDRVIDAVRKEAESPSGERALTESEKKASSLAGRMLKEGMAPKDIRSALINQGYAPRQVSAILATVPGYVEAQQVGGTIPFNEARARYTSLTRRIYGGSELLGEVGHALKGVRDALDSNIQDSLSSPTARTFYDQLKASYAQYMSDFYDPNGALTKIKGSLTGVDRVNILTGKWGKEALDAMARYRKFNPPFQELADVRSLNRSIENLPSSAPDVARSIADIKERFEAMGYKKIPEPEAKIPKQSAEIPKPKQPAIPEFGPRIPEPSVKVFDPVEARRKILQNKIPQEITPGLFMQLRAFRALMHKLENMPTIQDWLIQNPK